MAETPLASLSLTHVNYNPSDPLSYLSAWLALAPQGLCVVYVTIFITSREIEIALAFGGQLACEALNFILKRLIKEKRPDRLHHLGKGYGMPSSHAQFMAFWSVYVTFWLWLRFSPRKISPPQSASGQASPEVLSGDENMAANPTGPIKSSDTMPMKGSKLKSRTSGIESSPLSPLPVPDRMLGDETEENSILDESDDRAGPSLSMAYKLQLHHPHLTKLLLSTILFSLAGAVCFSRTYLEYHTAKQVYVGFGVGSACATAFFIATEIGRRLGYMDWLLELPLMRHLRVRDLACEEDLIELGWSLWERKRRERKRAQKRRKSVRFAGLPELPDEIKAVHRSRRGSDEKDRKKKKK